MRLASRMERIGTETAFEAAARARVLEATGVDVVHLEIGEPVRDRKSRLRRVRDALEAAESRAAGGTASGR